MIRSHWIFQLTSYSSPRIVVEQGELDRGEGLGEADSEHVQAGVPAPGYVGFQLFNLKVRSMLSKDVKVSILSKDPDTLQIWTEPGDAFNCLGT